MMVDKVCSSDKSYKTDRKFTPIIMKLGLQDKLL